MASDYVKTLTGVDNEQLTAIYNATQARLLAKLKQGKLEVVTVPETLAHIVDEVTISRFNYVGSEGMETETVEGHSSKYKPITLEDYDDEIKAYIAAEGGEEPPKVVVKFI